MSKLGEELNDFQISEMIREADKDGDGEIDFDEFVRMVTCWTLSNNSIFGAFELCSLQYRMNSFRNKLTWA